MICIPNINRAAENAFQKSNKEWDVFRAAQKEDGFRYPKELEPKPQKPLAELKDEEKSLYFSKEKDKLAYSFTEACGLIPFALCMAFLSTLSLCGKMFEFLENKPESF
jgi:transcription initiation factor IIE alpha subunit